MVEDVGGMRSAAADNSARIGRTRDSVLRVLWCRSLRMPSSLDVLNEAAKRFLVVLATLSARELVEAGLYVSAKSVGSQSIVFFVVAR
jgi:hypothetical protein